MNKLTIFILVTFLQAVLNSFIEYPSISFPQTNVMTKAADLNTLYSVGLSDFKVYRLNYTRFPSTPTYSYSTTHTKKVRAIAISHGQRYFATGSQDFTIQVVQGYTKTKLCTFKNYNQLRSLVFHPIYQQILYSGSVDDAIRKWNITNCSKLTQNTIGGNSINVININPDGTFINFGTYQGYVGKIDQNLSTFVINTIEHQMTVKYIFIMYSGSYVSIGDDNKMVVWDSNNNAVARLNSLSPNKVVNCGIFQQTQFNDTHRILGCQDSSNICVTYLATRTLARRFTNHACGQSGINWIDFRQLGADQQVWFIHYGTNAGILKVLDNNTVLCNTNNNHTGVDPVYKTCRFCGYNYPGCHFCNISGCTQCGIANYRVGGNCTQCPIQCSQCTSATNCGSCAVGYQPIGSSGKCRTAQSNPQPGCFEYTSSGSKCATPGNGYYINSGGVCKPCSQSNAGCMQCTLSTTPQCLTCKTGYYLSAGSCILCSNTMTDCLACVNSTVCLKCPIAYKTNGANNVTCSNCLGSCMTCTTVYDQCTSCYNSTQFRYLSGSSCLCLAGYYDTLSTINYTCKLCSSVLTNCYLCNNNSTCLQCYTNYYLYTSGSVTQCQQCSIFCQTCTGTSTNCTTCNLITYNRILSGNTCICSTGYVSVGNTVPCLPCDKLNIGCLSCANQTYCSSCNTGYYLKIYSTSSKLCQLCPYYCPSCTGSANGTAICSSCPPNSFRSLVGGSCPCITGYFDDNNTVVCQLCSSVLSNCLTCNNRTKCLSCGPGMYTDQSQSICATCNTLCLTCGAYFDVCASCDPATNRVLQANKCVCSSQTYQLNGICKPCSDSIPNCHQCSNAYICTSCDSGYTLAQDLKSCINCQGSINGCDTCTSQTNCTTCKNPFSLIKHRCRCPITQYTSKSNWGQCKDYGIAGLSSHLGVQIEVHQHQNNTLIVFIRFRAKTLYVLNKKVQQSIKLSINGVSCSVIQFAYIQNNHVKINTQLYTPYQKPNITITFQQDVFYNQYLLTLDNINQTIRPARLYYYQQSAINSYTAVKNVLTYTFAIFKWVFFGFTIIGQGHLLFPFVVFIQLMPLFLMLIMSLPANLSMVLDAMMSFQVKSVIPFMNMNSNFFVQFSPMTYDYYGLYDFLLFGKIGDMILLVFVNVMTKFDQGIVRMFAPGKIRRYLYQSLVRRGYSVMSLCILTFQPSMILLAGVYINFCQWQNTSQIFNYCCCVFAFGFYLAYNFNHASNLTGTKLMKNIQNQQCFFGINSQQITAPRTTLFVLVADFWIIGSLHLISPMVYFISSILLLTIKTILHIRPGYFIGKIQFALRTFSNIFLLTIFCLMFVFYLGENTIYIGFATADILGLVTTVLIFAYILFHIIEKILYTLKLENDFLENKVVKGENGEQIVVTNTKGIQNGDQGQQVQDNQSSKSQKMKQFFTAQKSNGFSGLNFRNKNKNNKNNNKDYDNQNNDRQNKMDRQEKQQSNYPMDNGNTLNNSYLNNDSNKNNKQANQQMPNRSDAFFNNSKEPENEKEKYARIKSANTSKYAKNHLQLRYKAQGILTKAPPKFQD